MSTQETTDAAAAAVATKATYVSSAATVLAGLTIGDIAALIGIFVTISAFIANIYYKVRTDRREQLEHELRVKELEKASHD